MCFYKTSCRSVLKTANNDILVYKSLKISSTGKTLRSPYRKGTIWKVGVIKKANLEINTYTHHVHQGLHSGKTYNEVRNIGDDIFICIIPRGAKYYENAKQYVSDKLILVSDKPLNQKYDKGKD